MIHIYLSIHRMEAYASLGNDKPSKKYWVLLVGWLVGRWGNFLDWNYRLNLCEDKTLRYWGHIIPLWCIDVTRTVFFMFLMYFFCLCRCTYYTHKHVLNPCQNAGGILWLLTVIDDDITQGILLAYIKVQTLSRNPTCDMKHCEFCSDTSPLLQTNKRNTFSSWYVFCNLILACMYLFSSSKAIMGNEDTFPEWSTLNATIAVHFTQQCQ